MKNNTTIVYLTGKPGVGKYTIAKELAKNNNFIICDNHLVNNLIFSLLQYNGHVKIPSFTWEFIERIWSQVFAFLSRFHEHSYVLTHNLYESERDRRLYEQVEYMSDARGSLFVPIRLSITKEEHLKRVIQPERENRLKTVNPEIIHDSTLLLSIIHPHLLELEVSHLCPEDAAEAIIAHINRLKI